jgi:hypothetical protein
MNANTTVDRARQSTIPQNASWLKEGMRTPDGSRVQSVDIWQDADRVDVIWASNGHLIRSNYKRDAQISILD